MNDLYLDYQRDLEEIFFMQHGRDASDDELKHLMQEYTLFQWADFNCYSYRGEK